MERLNRMIILSVTVGAGHLRAAEAVKKAAGAMNPSGEVRILDTFRYASPFLEKVVLGTYMEILKVSPVVYGYLYRQAERGQPLSGRAKSEFNRVLNLLAAPRLTDYIRRFQPQAIVCTHPFPLGIVSRLKEKGTYKGLLTATVTDYTLHSFWVFPGVDLYFAGAEELCSQFDEFGIERARVRPTGIPIDPAFERRYDREALREELGLAAGAPVVLVMGGGLGMGPLEAAVKSLLEYPLECQLLVVTGTNRPLYEKLSRKAAASPDRLKVYSYVNNVHQLMAASDLMVGKPGGLTCAEALACGLPMLMVDPLPGQEERNAEFLASTGAAMRVAGKELAKTAGFCLGDPAFLGKMSAAAARLGRPGAARSAVQAMEEMLRAGELLSG
ncbi:MAG: galactosyldiacylglycerol synthase [Peptococcaceae bacterium]|nr:galactosyldiacylglycerol synthase [Peptococcaceae bacterium]